VIIPRNIPPRARSDSPFFAENWSLTFYNDGLEEAGSVFSVTVAFEAQREPLWAIHSELLWAWFTSTVSPRVGEFH